MALRAGYKGIKKLAAGLKWNRPGELSLDDITLEDKIVDTAQPYVVANTKLLKDTVGWVNKQLITYPYTVSGTAVIATVNITPSNGKFTLNGTSNEAISMPFHYRQGAGTDNNPIILPAGKYKFVKTSNKVGFLIVRTVGGSGDIFVTVGNSDTVKEFTLSETTQIGLTLTADTGTVFSDEVVKFMICDADILDNTWEPYSTDTALSEIESLKDSASDQKTAINAIIAAATGAADFAAFKTAMGAITPVTRSIQVTPETREEITEPEEEPEVKKTTRKKSTAKADTEKEGD